MGPGGGPTGILALLSHACVFIAGLLPIRCHNKNSHKNKQKKTDWVAWWCASAVGSPSTIQL